MNKTRKGTGIVRQSTREDFMTRYVRTLRIFLVLCLSACSGIQVSQDYAPSTDFSAFDSYQWNARTQEKTGDPRLDNPLRDKRIREAIERTLEGKGFVLDEAEKPTFYVDYKNVLRRKIETSGPTGSVGFGVGSYGRRGGVAIGTGTEVREVDEGSLIIDVLSPESGDLLWRGTGNQRYREYTDPEKAARDINALVTKILEQFPPSGK
jgi:hypothetical protein